MRVGATELREVAGKPSRVSAPVGFLVEALEEICREKYRYGHFISFKE